MARNILKHGPSAAYHLTWAPLFPWLMALTNKLFSVPLEDAGRLITAISLVLRIIPVYILTRILFNRPVAATSTLLTILTPTVIVTKYSTYSEGFYSLAVLTGFLISFLALKYQKTILFLITGVLWGTAYLTRPEGWFFILVPLSLTLFAAYSHKSRKSFLQALILILFFLITALPYILFIHHAFGSWTLNPRIGITLVAPGSNFSPYQDNFGTTTLAQVYFSGEPQYYRSYLWHPRTFEVVRNFARTWDLLYIIPSQYLQLFLHTFTTLFIFGLLGIVIVLAQSVYKKPLLLLYALLFPILFYCLADFTFRTLSYLDLIGDRSLLYAISTLLELRFKHNPPAESVRNILVIFICPILLLIYRHQFPKLLKHLSKIKLALYLPLSLVLGFFPLLFNSCFDKYITWIIPIFAIYTSYFISIAAYHLPKNILRKIIPTGIAKLSSIIIFSIISVIIIKPYFKRGLAVRNYPNTSNTFYIEVFQKPGQAILSDFGPGAKIALFHEGPAFYAQGKPFFFITSHNFSISDTLRYFKKNNVDYFILHRDQAASYPQLKFLLDPDTTLSGWKRIYINSSLVSVWKRIR